MLSQQAGRVQCEGSARCGAKVPGVKDLSQARVPSEELAIFTREFATMHAAGISLVRSLEFYASSTSTDLGEICSAMVVRMELGAPLSRAMREYPAVFGDVYASLVEAGESSGEMRDILHKLADLHERTRKLRKRVISALTYPCILLVASLASISFFILVILPSIVPLFDSLHLKLPWITWFLASTGAALQRPAAWLGVVALGAGAVYGMRLFRRRLETDRWLRYHVESLILKVPVMGPVVQKIVSARVIYTISTLMQAGVFLETAILKAGKVSGNLVFERRVKDAVEDIHDGQRMSVALQQHRVFPLTILQIIAASEESGDLVVSLQRAATMFEEDVEVSLDSMTSLLEPLILVVMGVISAFIVLSVIIPTVQLLNNL